MVNLWSENTPARFWRCHPDPPIGDWFAAIESASPLLNLPVRAPDLDTLLALVLGEGQFGTDHWQLSLARRVYYQVKPLLPRPFTRWLRRLHGAATQPGFELNWPIEDRYARFLWEVMRQVLESSGNQALTHLRFWPYGKQFAFVLTHDIETGQGQSFVRAVAALEEDLGFRSSFNFVPKLYPLDYALMAELRDRGFEVGVHGLTHDGKLFASHDQFMHRAAHINKYLKQSDVVGFRAPLTMRHPEWMQALDIEYDLSFFDTDPHEPIPGGTMSLWPFFLGHFVELPYTLVQDYTLTAVMGERTPRRWLEKVDFIAQYSGMALLNSHPDFLRIETTGQVYAEFLRAMKNRSDSWHALPREVAHWWRQRSEASPETIPPGTCWGSITRAGDTIAIMEQPT
jgi:hypothetical protein